jgi:hypothetical protein
VIDVVNGLKEFWPLTLRQVYYQLVSRGLIENRVSDYNMLSKLVKWMRIDERLPWSCLEDRVRSVSEKRGFENIGEFITEELEYMFQGYSRCRVQGQGKYLEIWVEKDALSRLFQDVAWPYCLRCVVCRGYQSISFLADFYKRAVRAIELGQSPIIHYYGDLDASGVQMLEATQETLEEEMGLAGVTFRRCGLLPEHIERYNLPNDPQAVKKKDTRYKAYAKQYGDVAVELDSVPPKILQFLIRKNIEAELDMSRFQTEKVREAQDMEEIAAFREEAVSAVMGCYHRRFNV